MKKVVFLICCCLGLAACGQSGKLYLVEPDQDSLKIADRENSNDRSAFY